MSTRLAEDNLKLLEPGLLADVEIICGKDHQVIRAHKAILASRCPYFKAAFNGNWEEASSGKIILDEQKPETVSAILKYICTGDFFPSTLPVGTQCPFLKTCVELWICADYLRIDQLKEEATTYLRDATCAHLERLWTVSMINKDEDDVPQRDYGRNCWVLRDDNTKKLSAELGDALKVAYSSPAARPLQKLLSMLSVAMRHYFEPSAKLMDRVPGFRDDFSAILLYLHLNPSTSSRSPGGSDPTLFMRRRAATGHRPQCTQCSHKYDSDSDCEDSHYRYGTITVDPVTGGAVLWCLFCVTLEFPCYIDDMIKKALPE